MRISGWTTARLGGKLQVQMNAVESVFLSPPGRPIAPLVTVMMTDIVGSTGLVVALGDVRWGLLLERHNRAARTTIAAFSGRYVKSLGDGLLATFEDPVDALACAARLRSALRELGLTMRTGLHSGRIELLGDDITGVTVNIAGRICAAAEESEILVSPAVRDLVDTSLVGFTERGTHELRGLPGRWTLYSLTDRQLRIQAFVLPRHSAVGATGARSLMIVAQPVAGGPSHCRTPS